MACHSPNAAATNTRAGTIPAELEHISPSESESASASASASTSTSTSTSTSAVAPCTAAQTSASQLASCVSLSTSSTATNTTDDLHNHTSDAAAPPSTLDAPATSDVDPELRAPTLSAHNADPSDSTDQAAHNPAPSSTASLLPRASTTSTISSASSGSATPTNRSISTRPSQPHVAHARSHLLAASANAATLGPARRSISRLGVQPSNNRERIARNNVAASALSSSYTSNAVPSLFGFYSHDANPTAYANSAASSTNSTTSNVAPHVWQPPPRDAVYHNRTASNSSAPTRSSHPAFASPIATPRVGPLSFYPSTTPRQHARVSSNLGNAYRSTETQRTGAFHSASTTNSIDSTLSASSLPAEQPTFEETTTISFTWTIRDLHLLREEVEHSPPPSEGGRSVSAGAGKSDIWTNQPIFGDNKWKLELVRTTRPLPHHAQPPAFSPHGAVDNADDPSVSPTASALDRVPVETDDSNPTRTTITILSVYLTALVLDYTHANVEIPASIMVALRPIRAAVVRRGSQTGGYLWQRFYDYTFQKEADLFTCHDLPSVSDMLQDTNVARDDAIALTIQLGLGPGHTRALFSQPDHPAALHAPVEVAGHHIVPRAILNSLHGLLDDANTGDVRILVRERGILLPDLSDDASISDHGHHDGTVADSLGRIVPFPIGSTCPAAPASTESSEAATMTGIDDDQDRIFVRDRVLWAHASVLKNRSDYFDIMLHSDFSEGISRNYGSVDTSFGPARNVRTLQISDADFVTAYWFLRYLYTDDIHFADKQDVRSAVLDEEWTKGADLGYLTTGSTSGDAAPAVDLRKSMLVDWTPISQLKHYDDFNVDGMGYAMAAGTATGARSELSGSFVLQGPPTSKTAATSGSLRQRTSAAGLGDGSSASASVLAGGGNGVGARTLSAPNSPSGTTVSGAGQHRSADEASRVAGRAVCNVSAPLDQHDHPCAEPGPASALSIFKLAHRYNMYELMRLASLHMVATLTPQSAFPMLLATCMYTELHARIKTYVYQHWHLVSHTHEFEQCCDEVCMGMWGADAGKTMRAFVTSLVSPLRAAAS